MNTKLCWLTAVALCLAALGGCQHACQRPACGPVSGPQPGVLGPPSSGVFLPGGGQVPVVPPPQPLPTGPTTVQPLPSGGTFQPPPPPPPAPVNPQMSGSNTAPRPQARWQPSEVTIQLGTPQPLKQDPNAPQLVAATPKSNAYKPPAGPAVLPVGIPQFAMAHERVSAGLRPMLDDGLDWLKNNGYRTVIHLREPGLIDSADRKQVEKRGMVYVSLEVSPQLSRKTLDEFNKLVADAAGQPVFVYDRDGALAGSLWYLHFRTAEGAGAETARNRAAALGLREERAGLHREMWLRAHELLAE